MIHLGVNIDHVATLRQVRFAREPDPVWAAALCELAGAKNITVHLREDRRHIQLRDVELLRKTIRSKLNLEMANTVQMVKLALKLKPDQVTLVPEKRQELTTEGGVDISKNFFSLKKSIFKFKAQKILAGLFIDSQEGQIRRAQEAGADFIEFHTGPFSEAKSRREENQCLKKLFQGANLAHTLGLNIHAGHGLHYLNIHRILTVPYLEEVNIGHAIIARALFIGLEKAVREMVEMINTKISP
ncbi:MAG: pyridoxine 5'-phosphate synthase [Chlamydiae bacterium]|nr:pyridoxine 5'-phosphate synthase [Chlamydiota bacterium]MBI3278018.1 pyridoxine 5'-phosphate synthase [Chlamydiota bacterium]